MKWIAATATGVGVLQATGQLASALTGTKNPPALIWVNEYGSDLNLLSLLGNVLPGFLELVHLHWNILAYDALTPTLYNSQIRTNNLAPVMVVEQISPSMVEETASGNPLLSQIQACKAIIQLGTEACFGGMTLPPERVTRFDKLCKKLNTSVIKLPGIPTPPHHLVGILAHLEFLEFPRLDGHRRPLIYYGESVCLHCEHRADLQRGRYADDFGEQGCLLNLGCKGPITHNSCSKALWNGGQNWCVGAGSPCTGCAEPGYPDHGGMGLQGRLTSPNGSFQNGVWGSVGLAGWGVLGVVGAGVALQTIRKIFTTRENDSAIPPQPEEEA